MQKKLLGTVVYNRVKNLIMTGALPMGSKISESMLTEKLESTKAPVRDAIKRLSSEHLLDVRPKSGTFVFKFSHDDFDEFLHFRFILELNAMKLTINSSSENLIGSLSEIHDQMVFSLQKHRVYDYVRLDNEFHQVLINACKNRYIINSYATIAPRMSAVRNHLIDSGDHLDRGLKQHKDVIECLKEKDFERAEHILNKHILPEHGAYWKLTNIS